MTDSDQAADPPSLEEWQPGAFVSAVRPGEVCAWIVDLDRGLSAELVEVAEPGHALAFLDDVEKERAARFVRARDRRRFANCRAALRQILGEIVGSVPTSLVFSATGKGKPVLDFRAMGIGDADLRGGLRFNVSHSAELALIGVSHGREIGVDIERIKSVGEAERIVASFFTAAEQAEFAGIAADRRDLAFFRGWTRKESVLKGLGVGLAGLSANYETGFGFAELPAHFVPADPSPRVREWQLWEAGPRPGFVATVAVAI